MKDNAPVFITVWALILITTFLHVFFTEWLYDLVFQELHYLLPENINEYSDITREILISWAAEFITWIGSLPITAVPSSLAIVLITAVPVIYYATDRCPGPREIFSIISRKPLRYILASFVFGIITSIGLLLCVVPGTPIMDKDSWVGRQHLSRDAPSGDN